MFLTTVKHFQVLWQTLTCLRPRIAVFGTQRLFLSPHPFLTSLPHFGQFSLFFQLLTHVFMRLHLRSIVHWHLNAFLSVYTHFQDHSRPFHLFFTPFRYFWPFSVDFSSFRPLLSPYSSPYSYLNPPVTFLTTHHPFSSSTTHFSLISAHFHPFYHLSFNFPSPLATFNHFQSSCNHLEATYKLCNRFRANFSYFWLFLCVFTFIYHFLNLSKA